MIPQVSLLSYPRVVDVAETCQKGVMHVFIRQLIFDVLVAVVAVVQCIGNIYIWR